MRETKDSQYSNRGNYVIIGIAVVVLIFIVRLFFLQIVSSKYVEFAGGNAFLNRTVFPSRGLMYDRNGELMVYNQPGYDIMVIMKEVKSFDTLEFCNTIGLTKTQLVNRLSTIKDRKLNPGYSSYVPQMFMNQLSTKMYGVLQEKMFRFPGFYIQNRTLREYTYPFAAHLLGDVGEVNNKDMEIDSYYVQGDFSGRSGIEKSYENVLRGEKGKEILLRDAHGRIKGSYEDGKYDVEPIPGKSLTLTIDADLQLYAEQLMKNKMGSVVAIEPSTGEVLCFVSAPSYDPRLLVGRVRGSNFNRMLKESSKPLFDRPLMAAYPPGSTFKTAQALVLQQENVVNEQTAYPCSMGFHSGGLRVGCHSHASPLRLAPSIQHSCNAYYCYALKSYLDNRKKYSTVQTSLDKWRDYMVSMGFGKPLGIDLPGEKRGLIPNSNFYDKIYGPTGWRGLTIISISIGQGEVLATPLQICNLAATIANRGYFYTPHVVKEIESGSIEQKYKEKRNTLVDPIYYEPVVEGMFMAVSGTDGGTSRGAVIKDIEVCGKTGTAQNPHGKDHSIFMAFAPRVNPKIAIAVYIENAGFGATYAVPIATLLMEKYLKKEVAPENKWKEANMLNASFIKSTPDAQ